MVPWQWGAPTGLDAAKNTGNLYRFVQGIVVLALLPVYSQAQDQMA